MKQAAKDFWFTRRARRAAAALRHVESVTATQLARTLSDFARFAAEPAEREWLTKCERLRRELAVSSEKVRMRNFAKEAKTGAPYLDEYTLGDLCRRGAKPFVWNFLLFRLIRSFRPTHCLELGTSIGVSASYQSAALALNGEGALISLEGSEDLARAAERHLSSIGVTCTRVQIGKFMDTLPRALDELGTVDYAFIDGHFDSDATLQYWEMIRPHLSQDALYVCSGIRWSGEMHGAWKTIIAHPRVTLSADLYKYGIAVVGEHDWESV